MATDQFDLFQPKKPQRTLSAVEKLLADKAAYMKTAKWKKIRKAKLDRVLRMCGGGGEIRTHEAFRPSGFQDRRDQPLCHPSWKPLENVQRPTSNVQH